MLKKCGLISHKTFQKAEISALKNLTIFEVYIRVFLDEVFALYKKGLKSGYEQKQDNEKFFKGKLLFSQHIKHNFAHAERFFVEYEEFTVNRPENRLIKTTLAFLRGISSVDINRRDLHRLTMIFDGVEKSTHIQSDFQKCTGGRNMKEYETVLSLCKVFLNGYGFSTYVGKHNTVALLFPMEKLFEGYIAKCLQEQLEGWRVTSQSQKLHLFTEPKMFSLRPDVYLENEETVILLDTKWKALINKSAENYGISQADMYQMFAYYYRYTQSLGDSKKVKRVILVYPMVPGFGEQNIVGDWNIDNKTIVSARLIPYGKGNDHVFALSELIDELTKIK
jgi:5-methylcytosine-specific restriction enzyme subunit McrC